MNVAWRAVFPESTLPESIAEDLANRLRRCAELLGPLAITRNDKVDGNETIYFIRPVRDLSIIQGGAAYGLGGARSTLKEAITSLLESVASFDGCAIAETTSGDPVYGPLSYDKSSRLKTIGFITLSTAEKRQFEEAKS